MGIKPRFGKMKKVRRFSVLAALYQLGDGHSGPVMQTWGGTDNSCYGGMTTSSLQTGSAVT